MVDMKLLQYQDLCLWIFYHTGVRTKWPPFCKRHFQEYFLNQNIYYKPVVNKNPICAKMVYHESISNEILSETISFDNIFLMNLPQVKSF